MMCLSSLKLSIPSFRFGFSYSIISLQPKEHPLAFLVMCVCWQQILTAFVYLKLSLFNLNFWKLFSLAMK